MSTSCRLPIFTKISSVKPLPSGGEDIKGETTLKVLVACEESQAVTKAFRKLGAEAYSCDIEEPSGGHPEWHLQYDVREALKLNWDCIIAFPPCTYLCNSGVSWLVGRNAKPDRWGEMKAGAEFFKIFINHPCERVAIENPIMHKYAKEVIGVNYTQIIHPWMFGHTERKATCLWLRGLPKLVETNNVKSEMELLPKKEQQRLHYLPPSSHRAKLRSKTYLGIADAMATQWYDEINLSKQP